MIIVTALSLVSCEKNDIDTGTTSSADTAEKKSQVTVGEDGFIIIDGKKTDIYVGNEKVNVTYFFNGEKITISVPKYQAPSFFKPENIYASLTDYVSGFNGWYSDVSCKTPFDFGSKISGDVKICADWKINYTKAFTKVTEQAYSASSYGNASCFGTTNCFNSAWARYLKDDKGYYKGAAGIANYLKNVFTYDEETDTVSLNTSSGLHNISKQYNNTLINFSSAYSSYLEYCIRNEVELDTEIANQVEYAKKYFMQIDENAEGFHDHFAGTFTGPSDALQIMAMASLLGFKYDEETKDRYDILLKLTYENLDTNFWNATANYVEPFYQLCVDYDWFDKSKLPDYSESVVFTNADIIRGYGYKINMKEVNKVAFDNWLLGILKNGTVSASDRKAYLFMQSFEAGADVLGVYSPVRALI